MAPEYIGNHHCPKHGLMNVWVIVDELGNPDYVLVGTTERLVDATTPLSKTECRNLYSLELWNKAEEAAYNMSFDEGMWWTSLIVPFVSLESTSLKVDTRVSTLWSTSTSLFASGSHLNRNEEAMR